MMKPLGKSLDAVLQDLSQARKGAHAAWGHCSECTCPAFEGKGELCDNCGHKYEAHALQ